jgi:hypothetical protein
VLGKVGHALTGTAAAIGTNVGNGTFGAITVGDPAVAGVYTVRMQDATHYVVEDPAGVEIGHGVTAVAFAAGGLGFTWTAGGTPMVAGRQLHHHRRGRARASTCPTTRPAPTAASSPPAILFGGRDATSADKKAVATSAARCGSTPTSSSGAPTSPPRRRRPPPSPRWPPSPGHPGDLTAAPAFPRNPTLPEP